MNCPVGLTYNLKGLVNMAFTSFLLCLAAILGRTKSLISFSICSRVSFSTLLVAFFDSELINSSCCVEITIVSIPIGWLLSSYSIVTWLLASGRKYFIITFSLRIWANSWTIWWANTIGKGIKSSVSLQAYPNIIPWSPAPCSSGFWRSTPWFISGLCSCIVDITAQESAANLYSSFV